MRHRYAVQPLPAGPMRDFGYQWGVMDRETGTFVFKTAIKANAVKLAKIRNEPRKVPS
jgi:hypothetical protein